MCLPTREQFDKVVADDYKWKAMDYVFYGLCSMEPTEEIPLKDIVGSSVQVIARTYSALMQRGWAMDPFIKQLQTWTEDYTLQSKLEELPKDPIPTIEGLISSVKIHGWFCHHLKEGLECLEKVQGKQKHKPFCPRSFVAKWLHFHRPGVPIFDSKAEHALNEMNVKATPLGISDALPVDGPYKTFCQRLWTFAQGLGQPSPSVRELDVYLYCRKPP